ncbi:hypothetical protein H5V45_01830 [Nocardioides sp. KIGAM211]|uniref:Uncharacterized protein n=1 Tax=Nocardioides luti TaxID=2761101 RepID=A0A7X0RD23_9ACTN|nr:hypothetical protein [Nocardioides luti]MBB6626049.1 hypothetical protein [Nocardioides luti]
MNGIELAPLSMQRDDVPNARYLADSQVIVFVSTPLYSGSCPPRGRAEQSGSTVTVTVSETGDVCTADANRDLFLVQGFGGIPKRLIVKQDGQDEIDLSLAG